MTLEMQIRQKNPVELAFVGDAVYELLVRNYIANSIDTNAGRLHNLSVNFVCASAQSKALDRIFDNLTQEEQNIVRRGKNASKGTVPKNGDPKSYRSATALEALFGYLYLCGNQVRVQELFSLIIQTAEKETSSEN